MRLLWRIERTPETRAEAAADDRRDRDGRHRARRREGFGAISMRRVAERLGVGAMTLYTYVPAKSDLLDLMYDRVIGEYEVSFPEDSSWRDRLELIARAQWDLYREHRWIGHMPWTRVPLGPNILDDYETVSGRDRGHRPERQGDDRGAHPGVVVRARRRATRRRGDKPCRSSPRWTTRNGGPASARSSRSVWDPVRFPTLSSPDMAASLGAGRRRGWLLPRGGAGLVRVRSGAGARRRREVHRTTEPLIHGSSSPFGVRALPQRVDVLGTTSED